MTQLLPHTVLIGPDHHWCGVGTRPHCDSCHCGGVCVVGVQVEEGEVRGQGDVAECVPSVHLCHVHQVALDYAVPL